MLTISDEEGDLYNAIKAGASGMIKRGDERQQLPTPRLTDREMEVLKLVAILGQARRRATPRYRARRRTDHRRGLRAGGRSCRPRVRGL